MMKRILAIYLDPARAFRAAHALRRRGFRPDHIQVVIADGEPRRRFLAELIGLGLPAEEVRACRREIVDGAALVAVAIDGDAPMERMHAAAALGDAFQRRTVDVAPPAICHPA